MSKPPLLEGPKRPRRGNTRLWLALALVIGIPLAIWWLTRPPAEPPRARVLDVQMTDEERAKRREQAQLESAKREAEWAVVVKTKRISDTEELSLVELPPSSYSGMGPHFGVLRCLIYKNSEYHTTQFLCPGE